MIRYVLILSFALFLCAAPVALKAPTPPIVGPITLMSPPPLISTLNNMSLNEFLKMASKSMKKNIVLTDDIKGTVDYLSNQDIKGRDLLPLVKTALAINNYGLVDKGSYYYVVPANDLKNHPHSFPGSRSSSSYVSKVIHIKYTNVLPILEGVKSLLSASGSAFGVSDNGSLIVSDFPDNLLLIERLVSQIDQAPIKKNQLFKSYHLVNSSADSVANTIRSIFASDNNKSDFTISVNTDSNTLFAMGDSQNISRLDPMISDLDREQYQVYIQVRIIELNNDLSNKVGMKYGLDGGIVSSSNFFTFASNLSGSAVAPVSSFSLTKLTASLGNVNQLLTIGATLDLLQSEGVSKTLSDPSLLCLNNKESKIVVGKSLSFLTGTTTNSTGTSNALSRSDVGLTLTMKPLVASKDKLSLSVDALIENILPSVDTNNQPITTKQQLKTDSILHHGETIVLGGFVKSYESVIEDGIPFLSKIPYLGKLFQHSSTITQKDNLLLVITPYIIDDSKTLSSLQKDLGALGQLQQLYNQQITKK